MIKYIYITSQQMRGIHINNYIDNRIMLSGRKVKNEVQAVIQSQKPKPMIIPHIKYNQQIQPTEEAKAIKHDPHSSNKKRKKRTRTVIVNQDHQKNDKNRMKIPLEQLKNLAASNKKRSNSSSPSKESETINLMQTQRKLRPIYENGPGLGKRSKSAIIKRTKQPKSQEKQKHTLETKSVGKKNKKKVKPNNSNNNINNSATPSHKNMNKPKDNQKNIKEKSLSKKHYQKSKKNLAPPQIKKMSSELNLSVKKKKTENTSAVTTARKANRVPSKSYTSSANISKPQSARGYKKIKGAQIKEEMNKKIFSNEGIDPSNHEKYLQSFNFEKSQEIGGVQKMLTQLQKELNTVGSRRKMQKELKKLLEKIEAMPSDKESEQEDSHQQYNPDNSTKRGQFLKHPLIQPSQSDPNEQSLTQQPKKPSIFSENQSQELSNNQNPQNFFISQQNDDGYQQIFPEKTDQSNKISQSQKKIQLEELLDGPSPPKSPQNAKKQENCQDQEIIQFNPDEDISYEANNNRDIANYIEGYDDQKGFNINNVYERLEEDIFPERNNLIDSARYLDDNPMLSRRNNQCLDINEYQSIKSHQNQRQAEIAQLKKFREESNKMMQKVKKYVPPQEEHDERSADQKNSTKKNNLQIEVNDEEEDKGEEKSVSMGPLTPKNMQAYTFERYPSPILNQLKSPKFNEHSINQIVKLKQKVQLNHHNKLNQLINTMFQNNVLSPKTHQIQISLLKAEHQKQQENLKNYQKHADEFSKILQEIRMEKEQINGIEEMIRAERWDQAREIVKRRQQVAQENLQNQRCIEQISLQSSQQNSFRSPLPREQKRLPQNYSDNEQQQHIYYEGQPSNDNQQLNLLSKQEQQSSQMENSSGQFNLIKLRHIQNKEVEQQPNHFEQGVNAENDSIIKIDEDEIQVPENEELVKKQRGFQSNLFFIKEYCIALCQFVRDYYNNDFKSAIGKPISYNLPQLLKAFRTKKDQSPAIRLNSLFQELSYHQCEKKAQELPISEFIFEEFNKTYDGNRYFGKEDSQDATLQGIFLKSIFNALNESVSIERPGSIFGKPLPWSHTAKHLKNMKNATSENARSRHLKVNSDSEDLIFGIAIARIIQWGSCLCGFIPDTVELQNTQIDDEYINHIRQTRMALLLQKMLVEQQNQMSHMQLEDTQVKLCISQQLAEQLIREAAQELQKIKKRDVIRNIDY